MRVHPLTPPRFAWLEAVGPGGAALGDAVGATARKTGEIMADLMIWLPDAVASGICCAAI